MSKSSPLRTLILMCALIVSVSFAASDLTAGARLQQENPGMSATEQNTNTGATEQNANTSAPRQRPTRRRGGQRRTAANMNTAVSTEDAGTDQNMQNANANMAGGAQDMTRQTTTTGSQTRSLRAGTPADLSGTYTGTVNYEEGGLTGDATLTITGDRFTLTSGTQTITGRLTATQWPGYIVVAMQLGEAQAPAAGQTATPPVSLSLRARRSGDRLTLTPAPGSLRQFSFTPTGARAPRGRRGRRGATPATPAEPATPADPGRAGEPTTPATPAMPATPADPAMPEPARSPAGGRRAGPRGRRGNTNANTNTNPSDDPNANANTNANPATPQVTPTP